MEDFLEGNTQLSDWHVNSEEGRFVIVTLLIWVNVPFHLLNVETLFMSWRISAIKGLK